MPFPDFDPVLIHIGPIAVRWYALAYVAGILLGWRYGVALVRNRRLWNGPPTTTDRQIDDFVLWVTLGIILGGRIGYILFYMLFQQRAQLLADPLMIFRTWEGGMSFHGGMIGVAIAIVGFARRNRIPLLGLADLTAPCVPIGLFFGRLANFINGELWGRPTHAPWGIVFCNARLAQTYGGGCPAGTAPRHPSQLYEAALEGVLLFIILRLATHRWRWLNRRGAIAGLFLTFYALFRISLENVREPDLGMPNFPFGLTMGILLSIPMLLAGLGLLAWALLREPGVAPPDPGAEAPPAGRRDEAHAVGQPSGDEPEAAADPFRAYDAPPERPAAALAVPDEPGRAA